MTQHMDAARRRFWSKVAIGAAEDCWLWTGGVHKRPRGGDYGQFSAVNVKEMRGLLAHRWAMFFQLGRIPEEVSHLCNQTLCVNPSHLKEGTHLENEQHKDLSGRRPMGTKDLLCPTCGGPQEGRSKRKSRSTTTPGATRVFAFCIQCRRQYLKDYHQKRKAGDA